MAQVVDEGADLGRTRITDDKQVGSKEKERNPPPVLVSASKKQKGPDQEDETFDP